MNKEELLAGIRDNEPARIFWKKAISSHISDDDDLNLIKKCLSKHTWTDNQARYLHLIAIRKYQANEEVQNG